MNQRVLSLADMKDNKDHNGIAGIEQNWVLNYRLLSFRRSCLLSLYLSISTVMFFAADSWAGVGGSLSGTVKDASSAVVPNGTVKATNVGTGVQQQVTTNDQGF